VSLAEVSSFLLSLRPEESLRRDTILWMEVRTEAGFMFIKHVLIPIQTHDLLLLI